MISTIAHNLRRMHFAWIALHIFVVLAANGQPFQAPHQSCLDHLQSGTSKNGYYSITDQSGSSLTVYCDFESEPGSAWTLVMSWSFQNKDLPAYRSASLKENVLVNEKTPNWIAYRQSKNAINFLKSQSSHWRATCCFDKVKFDYRDYMRGSFNDFDITTFQGDNQCKKVEYINIRGHVGYQVTVAFWQKENAYLVHTDSSYRSCQYGGAPASSFEEDNFGHYNYYNSHFRCTSDPSATTQYWFGGYI